MDRGQISRKYGQGSEVVKLLKVLWPTDMTIELTHWILQNQISDVDIGAGRTRLLSSFFGHEEEFEAVEHMLCHCPSMFWMSKDMK